MSNHRVRTHSGHRLYLQRLEGYAPGEVTEMELTAAHLTLLRDDPRVLVDEQIENFLALCSAPRSKPRGNTPAPRKAGNENAAPARATEPTEDDTAPSKPKRRGRSKRSEV